MEQVKQLINIPVHHNKVYIYEGVLDQIRVLYPINPELAGKLAIAAIETVFTEHHSFEDDPMIAVAMVPFIALASNNNSIYEERVERDKDKKLQEWRLDEIANLINNGISQTEIAKELHLSKSTVSRRVGAIRSDYPWLLQESSTDSSNFVPQNTENFMKSHEISETPENCATFQKSHEIPEISRESRNVPQIPEISKVAQEIDIDIDIDKEIENETDKEIENETLDISTFKKRVYVNSYDEECTTTGYEILEDYNFDNDDEVIEMSNEFPEAYEDLIKLGVIKRKQWVF